MEITYVNHKRITIDSLQEPSDTVRGGFAIEAEDYPTTTGSPLEFTYVNQ